MFGSIIETRLIDRRHAPAAAAVIASDAGDATMRQWRTPQAAALGPRPAASQQVMP